jgi:hypothetical protein
MICTTVENDFLDAGLDRALRDQFANGCSSSGVGTGLQVGASGRLQASMQRQACGLPHRR